MTSIVCHKVGIDEHNPELGGFLQHAGVCDCFCEQELGRIQRQSNGKGRSPGISV